MLKRQVSMCARTKHYAWNAPTMKATGICISWLLILVEATPMIALIPVDTWPTPTVVLTCRNLRWFMRAKPRRIVRFQLLWIISAMVFLVIRVNGRISIWRSSMNVDMRNQRSAILKVWYKMHLLLVMLVVTVCWAIPEIRTPIRRHGNPKNLINIFQWEFPKNYC